MYKFLVSKEFFGSTSNHENNNFQPNALFERQTKLFYSFTSSQHKMAPHKGVPRDTTVTPGYRMVHYIPPSRWPCWRPASKPLRTCCRCSWRWWRRWTETWDAASWGSCWASGPRAVGQRHAHSTRRRGPWPVNLGKDSVVIITNIDIKAIFWIIKHIYKCLTTYMYVHIKKECHLAPLPILVLA